MQNSDEKRPQPDLDHMLDQILKTDIMVPLPDGFADRIARKAVRRMALKQSVTEFLVYAGVILSVMCTVLAVTYFLSRENWDRWTGILASHMSVISGIVLVLGFVLFLDRILLPVLFNSRQKEMNNPY